MFTCRQVTHASVAIVLAIVSAVGCSEQRVLDYPSQYDLGLEVPEETTMALLTTIPPDGEGLPDGKGTFDQGEAVYHAKCGSCHGPDLLGTPAGPPLIGGRESLATDRPLKTVESYWPYATSVFSYTRNAMPTTSPGSLTNEEVYALMAYILGSAGIIDSSDVVNRNTLPMIKMPNRDGFVPDSRPDISSRDPGHRKRVDLLK